MIVVQRRSPHQNARPLHAIIDTIVLHADAGITEEGTVHHLEHPHPNDPRARVSYHALIGRTGKVYTFVPLHRRAWHAGVSAFNGRPHCNDYSIGVAFANKNNGREVINDVQLATAAAVCASYMRLHPAITLDRITTHAIVSPGRKTDPCPPFDLDAFRTLVALEVATDYPRPAA